MYLPIPPQTLALDGALQLPRILDTANPLTDVAFITPQPIDQDVLSYWQKLLEVGGVNEPHTRFKVLHPENTQRLPPLLPLASRLLASPKALKRLKLFLKARPAYLIPG